MTSQRPLSTFPLVSAIIPTFHSGKTLENCLRSIKNQSYKNVELIIVDAFSKDNTREIAERFTARIFLLAAERSPARNFGVKQAKGKFLLFIDSDMELTSNVIEECVKLSIRRDIDAVIIPEESVGESFLAKCKKLEKMMRWREAYGEAPRFLKKEIFGFIGGYNQDLVIGEDFELTQKLQNAGFAIGRCEAIIKHHEENLSIKKLTAKLYHYGKTLPAYLRKEPLLTFKTSSPIRFLKNLSQLKQQPIYFTGLCTLKLVEYAAYLTGALAYVLQKVADKSSG